MSPRTSTAEAILRALQAGPATAEELRTSSRRRQALIDKTLTDLANDGRITAVHQDRDPEDKPHWHLTDPTTDTSPDTDQKPGSQPSNTTTDSSDEISPEPTPDTAAEDSEPAEPSAAETPSAAEDLLASDPERNTALDQSTAPDQNVTPDDGTVPDDGAPAVVDEEAGTTTTTEPGADNAEPPGNTPDGRPEGLHDPDDMSATGEAESPGHTPEASTAPDPEPLAAPGEGMESEGSPEAPEVKVCRGCQTQMPMVCPSCRQKTPSYCGQCRDARPTRRRRGGSGEPEILSNGLPKLRRGELIQLVLQVMRTHPVPDFVGVTGWTSARIAVYLPGRSTGAIGEALTRLAATGHADLLDENPRRYAPTPDNHDTDHHDTDNHDASTDQAASDDPQ